MADGVQKRTEIKKELLKKVSGRSDAKFEHFRIEKKLRNSNMYNKHMKTCEPADEDHGPILLPDFLKNLIKCFKTAFSQ
uniref:Uncharacterized protein n=1 Tax=Cyprinus carpio TaxID=7962 RepID=A0A8C2IQF2_CYPCA